MPFHSDLKSTASRVVCQVFLVCMAYPVFCQDAGHPAMLREKLVSARPDTGKISTLLQLGSYYMFKPDERRDDLDSALYFFRHAMSLSEDIHSQKWKIESLWYLSLCHYEREELQLARDLFADIMQDAQAKADIKAEADAWMTMGVLMFRSEATYDDRISYLENARSLYLRIDEKRRATDAYKEIADSHLNQGKLDEAENELLQVIEEYEAVGYPDLHYTYDLLAAISTLKGNLNRALFYGMQMMKSMEITGDSSHAVTFYLRMSRIYAGLGQYEQSVEFARKSYAKHKGMNYEVGMFIVSGMIRLGKAAEALDFLQTEVRQFPPERAYHRTIVAHAFGECYAALKQYGQAETHYREMVNLERGFTKQNHFTSIVHYTIGQFFVDQGRFREARPYLQNVLDIPAGIVLLQRLKDTHLLLFKVDSAEGDYLNAIKHYQQHKMLNDSIFNETKSQQIEELQIQYETENKERDIQLLQNTSALQVSRIRQMQLTRNLTFGGGILVLIILGLVYNRFRLKQRSTRQLELQQIEIHQTNQALQILVEEKERLLREIHHRVKNNLQIVMSLLNSQSVFLDNETALAAIRDSQHRIHSISLIHQKLYQSKDTALVDMSMYIGELTHYLKGCADQRKSLHFDLNVEQVELDVTQAVPVGLILNEAISNAIKYAFPGSRTGTISVSMFHTGPGQVTLTVSDDGVGLPEHFDLAHTNSLGMSLMQGLSKQLHGRFNLTNRHGLTVSTVFEIQHATKQDMPVNPTLSTA